MRYVWLVCVMCGMCAICTLQSRTSSLRSKHESLRFVGCDRQGTSNDRFLSVVISMAYALICCIAHMQICVCRICTYSCRYYVQSQACHMGRFQHILYEDDVSMSSVQIHACVTCGLSVLCAGVSVAQAQICSNTTAADEQQRCELETVQSCASLKFSSCIID